MSVWLKVCGITDDAGLDAALAAGVDAVGFVFAKSPREIDIDTACALKARVNGAAAIVAVMRHPEPARAKRVIDVLQPDFLQTDYADFDTLGLPLSSTTLPVVRGAERPPLLPRTVLYEGQASGVGELADWDAAHALARRTRVIVAGGLDPDNVAAAIAAVQPYGVDVSSGVEVRRGVKDAALIQRFAKAVRATPAPWLSH